MSEAVNFAETMAAWAASEPSVKALILIGSRVRAASDTVWTADSESDWDFHLITSRPGMFANSDWTRNLASVELLAYVSRVARIGGIPKANLVFRHGEADVVILPERTFLFLEWATRCGLHRHSNTIRRRLQDLALVVRPGWKFLKGSAAWEPLYKRAVTEVPDPRLSDAEARHLADGFVCDYVCILRRIARGEVVAAQRLLHRDLAETNFRLLHEFRLRRGERTFPEARRIERVAPPGELEQVSVNGQLDPEGLSAAAQKCAETCRGLMRELVGESWRWPAL